MYLDYLPYSSLRPYQDKMLDAVYDVISRGGHGILMIDAPTGTGKTSCISAALSAAPGKVIVAVRTVSQIDIYVEEIKKIWDNTRYQPEIAYLVGKQKMCPLEEEFTDESVYAGCSRLKEWTTGYITARTAKGRDAIYDPAQESMPQEEPGYRTFCPFYLRSREAFELNGKLHLRRSSSALDVVEALKREVTPPARLKEACGGLCPYEIMGLYAKGSDVVIVNYSHLFSPDFQDAIFPWLEAEPEKVTLIIDEAHNLGNAVRAMNSRLLTMRMLDLAARELEKFEGSLGQAKLSESGQTSWRREGIKVVRTLLPRLKRFLQKREDRTAEGEALLDSDLFRSFLYQEIADVDEALGYFSEVAVAVAELKLAEGDRENLQGDLQPNLAQVLLFLMDVERGEEDPAFQRKIAVGGGQRKRAWMTVNNIDPAPVIRRMTDQVNATIMLSGTFSPLEAYELYFLAEEGRAEKLNLPNPFPKENRLLIASSRATTELEKRDEAENRKEMEEHIQSLIELVPGNVAVFFTSYPLMNSYRHLCQASARRSGKMLCIEPRSAEEVPDVLEEFFGLAGRQGGVLLGVCGGKLAEGIDYRGEALLGVAVVGLPLAVYDEIQREINAYYIRKYGKAKGMLIAYTLPAMNRGLQAAGRVIRAESERGVLLFCDRRFGNDSLGGVRRFLPAWVRDELMVADAIGCRRIILETIERWSRDPISGPAPPSVKTGPRKAASRRRDIRELAKKLGLAESASRRQEE